MWCINCGTKLPDNAKFCMNCGTKVENVAINEKEPINTDKDIVEKDIVDESQATMPLEDEELDLMFDIPVKDLDKSLMKNPIYTAIRANMPDNLYEIIIKAYNSIQDIYIKKNIHLIDAYTNPKTKDKLSIAMKTYASIRDENVIAFYDSTTFGSGKTGFIITDKKIYVHNPLETAWSISIKNLETVQLVKDYVFINDKKLSIITTNNKTREDVRDFLEVVLFLGKYSRNYNMVAYSLEEQKNLSRAKTQQSVEEFFEDNSAEGVLNYIHNVVANMKETKIKNYLYVYNENSLANKKIQVAIDIYAHISEEEKPILVYDNTVNSNGKDGFLLTDNCIYVHNIWEKSVKVYLNDIKSIEIKGANLIIDDSKISITMIDKNYREKFKDYIQDFITRLNLII